MISDDQIDLILHTAKAIAKDRERHNKYVDDMFDMLFQELGVRAKDSKAIKPVITKEK